MLTPAQEHFQRVMAERRGQVVVDDSATRTAHEQILFRLRLHQSNLKQIQSRQAKAAMKAEIIPEFLPWIDGAIEGDSGRQDAVVATVMAWAIDCQNYPLALRIGRYVIKHNLALPDNYRRDAATMLTEEICNPVLTLATTNADADLSDYVPMLDELADVVAGRDMPDEVRSKLCKARAFSRRASADQETQGEALRLFREAMSLNPGAGVKREISALTSALKNGGVSDEPATAEQPEKAPAQAPSRKTKPRATKKVPRKSAKQKTEQ
ncbi:TPA: terminase [Klebsiella pneumoniae]|uniref:phage terminase small subunit n=1 Tax=Klebsiella pneumoniae TaxID=573 RepID=UPI000E2E8C48|nr:phage terminase small subunit [Klebsiella pneumoniae]HBR1366652.1 terminase [Klebsiella pneumoniae]HBR2015021.1 terminase [Klebsiella pneumoniae]